MKILLLLWPFPLCRNFLAVCPRHFVEASVWMTIWGSRSWNFLPLQSFKFFIHQRSSSLDKLLSHDHFRIPFSVELIFVFAEDIETRFLLAKRFGQLMAAGQLTLWDLGLKFLAAWKSPEIVETHALIFSLMERKVVFFVSIVKPRNSICFTGWRTDFSRLIIKLKCCIRKINVSRHENFL